MVYTKQWWSDNNPSYPVSAARMSHIEDGIAAASTNTGTAAEADKLSTSQEIAGHPFDGTAPVTIVATDVGAVPAMSTGVRMWPAGTTFPSVGVQVGDLFPYIGTP